MNRSRILLAAGVVLFVAFALKRVERKSEEPAPQPAPTAPGPVAPAPQGVQTTPVLPAPPAQEPPAPAPIVKEQFIRHDLDVLLKEAESLGNPPEEAKLLAACRAAPRATARELGMSVAEEPALAKAALMLCNRRLDDCDQVVAAGGPGIKACPNPPCTDLIVIGQTEGIPRDVKGCRQWGANLLYLATALQGRPDPAFCGTYLDSYEMGFTQADKDKLCPLLASDLRDGGRSFCTELAGGYKHSGKSVTVPDCVYELSFATGEKDCEKMRKGSGGQPTCQLRARLYAAFKSKDTTACAGDPFCLAFFQTSGCSEERLVDLRNPGWNQVCEASVTQGQMKWAINTSERGRFVLDRLGSYRHRLPDDLTDAARREYDARIDRDWGKLDRAIKSAESMRAQANRGKLPGQKPPIK